MINDVMTCISSSDKYLLGRKLSRTTLLRQGYRHVYIRDRMVHLFTSGNTYIELSQLSFDAGMELLEQGN